MAPLPHQPYDEQKHADVMNMASKAQQGASEEIQTVQDQWTQEAMRSSTLLPPLPIEDTSANPLEMAIQSYPQPWRRSDGRLFYLMNVCQAALSDPNMIGMCLLVEEQTQGAPTYHWTEMVRGADALLPRPLPEEGETQPLRNVEGGDGQ